MAYKRKIWKTGEIVKKEGINNIENGIYEAHQQLKDLHNYDDADIRNMIGYGTLLTSSKDLKGAINELFQSASNGKTLIAQAITGKGVSTSNTATFQEMATNISLISGNATGKTLTLDNKKYILSEDDNGNITATIIKFSITNELTNASNDNSAIQVDYGNGYSATITANSGYTLSSITVIMGETDITDTAVNIKTDNATVSEESLSVSGSVSEESLSVSGSVVVNISNVTGNIVIFATAVEEDSGGEEEPPTILSNMTYGKGVNLNTGVIRDDVACWATIDPITAVVGRTYQISLDASWVWVLSYDESDNFVSRLVQGNGNIPQVYTFTATTTKIRYGCYDPNKQLTYCNLTEVTSTYTITRNLSNCTSSNNINSVAQGTSYLTTITPNSGYELINVAITMGGANVTSSVYTYQNGNAVINIPSVTGNVVITVQVRASSSGGEEEPPTVLSNMTYGKGVVQKTGIIKDNAECWATIDPITVEIGKTYRLRLDATWAWVYSYDESDNRVTILSRGSNVNPQDVTFTADTTKIRYGCYDPSKQLTYCNLTKVSSSVTTYTITQNLPNCTSSNPTSSINENANYSTLISANNGYKIDSITVTMNGADITSSVVTDEAEIVLYKIPDMTVHKGQTFNILYSSNISAVKHEFSWDGGKTFWDKTNEILVENTVNYRYRHNADTEYDLFNMAIRVTDANGNTDVKYFTITFENNVTEPGETFYTVTKNLTNCSSSNNTTSITEGASYTTNITANNGYALSSMTVTMGGSNITSTVVDGNTINIPNVSGNIVINAIAVAVAESSDLLDSTGAYMVDDFTGSSVDRSKWDYELGYVRNGELQNYTSTNTEVNNSILALKGIKDSNGNWTSSSIISKGHFAFMYGKIECRAKIDPTWGSFSAFWTLGDSFEFGYHDGASPDTLGEWWAYCGEFDVMEFYSGKLTCGTFFNEREESGRVWYNNYDFNAWHTFAMEWLEDGTLIFSIDGNELSRTSATTNRAFHIPHFILINQAIGASGGTPESGTTAITQYVDWVKYYPASTENVVLNSSNFNLEVTDHNDNAHNCMVRPIFYDNCINKSLTWSSSDSSLVWVHSGLCGTYAGANGTVTITATSHSGVSKSITLTVTDGTIR